MNKGLLDKREKLMELDKDNLLGSIEALPLQIKDAWDRKDSIEFGKGYENIKNVVVMGMGGSSLGSMVIKSLFKDELKVPFEVCRGYMPPKYTNGNTLVLLSSYSGTTEETLEAQKHAESMGAKIAVITAGGALLESTKENKYPLFKIDAKHNPSSQPRMAMGYAVFGQIAIFQKLGLIKIEDSLVSTLVSSLEATNKRLNPESEESNSAKLMAYSSYEKMIVLVSSGHLLGATRVFNNQINENAKNMTAEHPLPEFNHHYMEGLKFPQSIKESTIFLLFQSALFHKQIQKRIPLTQSIIHKEGMQAEVIQATAPTKLEQVFEIIQLGSYISFYLGMLNGVNPGPVPNVEHFKSELKRLG